MAIEDTIAGSTVTALFDTRPAANAAVDALVAAGIPHSDINLVAGSAATSTDPAEHKGFWTSLKDFLFPPEDRFAYAEGLRRGGYLVTVTNLSADRHLTAVDILDREGAVNLDERAALWAGEGWPGYADTADTAYAPDMAPVVKPVTARASNDDVIPVVREELRVGKRDVNLGRVRVRSYALEEPVSEDVNLHDERVVVERRPVDRAVAANDTAFQDRIIEAEEHSEEAVVSKQARIVEEVAVRREGSDHVETVSDTLRHTEVEVDDERAAAPRRSGRPS